MQRHGIRLIGSTLTLNPDFIVQEDGCVAATGDVKYKLATREWKRGDLYQAVTFATGFGVNIAAIGSSVSRMLLDCGRSLLESFKLLT